MKVLLKQAIVEKGSHKEVFRERDLLTQLRHNRICNSYFAFQDDLRLYIVMDIALGGDLRYQLKHTVNGQSFTEDQARIYISQIVLALEYVHSQGVLHRDIKPENILMDERGWLKLTDFGIARDVDASGKCYSTSGTHGYMAPEIYKQNHAHSYEADWFSLGVTAHELMTKTRPFRSDQLKQSPVCSTGRSKDLKSGSPRIELEQDLENMITPNGCKFLRAILRANPTKRLGFKGAQEIRNSDWFNMRGFDWKTIEEGTMQAPFVPDVTKMNADPTDDMQAVFLGEDNEKKLRRLTNEEQERFNGYEYDYRYSEPKRLSEKRAFSMSEKLPTTKEDSDNEFEKTESSMSEKSITEQDNIQEKENNKSLIPNGKTLEENPSSLASSGLPNAASTVPPVAPP